MRFCHSRIFLAGIQILVVLGLSGCTKLKLLPYLDQALLLQDFGQEKTQQQKIVDNTNALYDKLTAAIQSGDIAQYKTEKSIIKAFGQPVLSREQALDGKALKQSLYRYSILRTARDKVYLYYDPQGKLVKWESQPLSS
jgi:hypothetical protein